MNITVAGLGYVGLSLVVLLAQHNNVITIDIGSTKADKLNGNVSPIRHPKTTSGPRRRSWLRCCGRVRRRKMCL